MPKKTHKKERTVQVRTKNCELHLREATTLRNDSDMLCRLGPEDCSDLIAQDAVYHKSCLASYSGKRNLSVAHKSDTKDETVEGAGIYDTAF